MKRLFTSLVSLLAYFCMLMLFFLLIQKPLFFFYNQSFTPADFSGSDVAQIFLHGLRLDLATCAYISVIPLLLIVVRYWAPRFPLRITWWVYNGIIALIVSLIAIADASLYEFWEFKLDATVLMYLDDPKNAFASVSAGYVVLRILIWLLLAAVMWAMMSWPTLLVKDKEGYSRKARIWSIPTSVLAAGILFMFIRGVELWPNNPSVAFYSNKMFYNHTALNPVFNCIYSMTRSQSFGDQYQTVDPAIADREWEKMYAKVNPDSIIPILNTSRPNILLVALEGMGGCFVGNLGGDSVVAPNIDRISQESVNFKNAYCGSFRTDRGIVCLLSGYPGQTKSSIMRYPGKVKSLPGLPTTLKEKGGYSTRMVYSSDATFFNMSGYFFSSGLDELITQEDFPAKERTTKWGVPDEKAFDWLYDQLQKEVPDKSHPHFNSILTISSHTPFDVPYHRLEDEKKNGFAYTDSCFGAFIKKLKDSPAWDNLMVVVTSDHGFNHDPLTSTKFAKVPLFITGGAVTSPMTVENITSQMDVAAIILAQLGIDYDEYIFSRNTLSRDYKDQWAINVFNDGFTFFDPRGGTVYLNESKKVIEGPDSLRELRGRVFLQKLYQDLDQR